jgi:hypothetical protein
MTPHNQINFFASQPIGPVIFLKKGEKSEVFTNMPPLNQKVLIPFTKFFKNPTYLKHSIKNLRKKK